MKNKSLLSIEKVLQNEKKRFIITIKKILVLKSNDLKSYFDEKYKKILER